jgi:type II secretory pathway component GspD/PulD (secretin)
MKGNLKMKFVFLPVLLLSVAALGASELEEIKKPRKTADQATTFTSLDRPDRGGGANEMAPGLIAFKEADVPAILEVYQMLSGRTVIRAPSLPAAKITLKTQTALTRIEALQLLDTALAMNGIAVVPMGKKFVKAVPSVQAGTEAVAPTDLKPDQLPESNSLVMYIVELKHSRPRDVAQALVPFSKLPNSVLGIDSAGLLILRDYSANVRRMLEVLARVDREGREQPGEKAEKPGKKGSR